MMTRPLTRTYSRHSNEALGLMGQMIRLGRISRKMTGKEMADRAGISRSLLQRIERGDPGCAIGVVFEVAVIAGVSLFDADHEQLRTHSAAAREKLSLLPKAARRPKRVVHDDF